MERIKDLINQVEKLDVIPTGMKTGYVKDSEIKAIIFDIYGTLLISASGDIDQAEISEKNLERALLQNNFTLCQNGREGEIILNDTLVYFQDTIKRHQEQRKKEGVPFPEVNILHVWQEVIDNAMKNNWVHVNENSDLWSMTFEFELLSNKIYPMPNAKRVVDSFSSRNMPLGIISNAQFYTPVTMNYFFHGEFVNDTRHVKPFDADLSVFSYQLLKAKPDISLFLKLVPVLKEKYQLDPANVLFVGNDMYKDVFPAHEAGFKTALFAGDKRSLRLRTEKKEIRGIKPDFVITDLKQLLEIIDI